MPYVQSDGKFTSKNTNIQAIKLNCTSTKLLLVDVNGILSLYDVDKRKGQVAQLDFERKVGGKGSGGATGL